MRKLFGAVLALAVFMGVASPADARTIKAKPVIVHEDDISGLLYRIDTIRETGNSDDAVLLAFWLEGASTAEINKALCIRQKESGGGNGIGVINRRNKQDSGPMQINRRTWERVARDMGYTWDQVVWDPWVNAIMATEVWWRAGYSFRDWTTQGSC